MMDNSESKCLIIVGMHRSGTSLLTSILKHAGLSIGEELLEPHDCNKNGFFENMDFLQFHQHVLTHPDGWDLQTVDTLPEEQDRMASELISKNARAEWGWKDPRTTLLMDYWRKKIPNAYFLFIYRNPWDVVDSLFRRGTDEKIITNPELAFHAWDFYNRQIIEKYKENKEKSILISIEDILKDTPAFLKSINNRFGFHLNPSNTDKLFDAKLLKDSRCNYFRIWHTITVFPDVMETFNELRDLSGKQRYDEVDLSRIEKSENFCKNMIEDWFYSAYAKKRVNSFFSEKEKLYAEFNNEKERLQETIQDLKGEIEWMTKTPFWKLRNMWLRLKRLV
jgi:hypothetical protein